MGSESLYRIEINPVDRAAHSIFTKPLTAIVVTRLNTTIFSHYTTEFVIENIPSSYSRIVKKTWREIMDAFHGNRPSLTFLDINPTPVPEYPEVFPPPPQNPTQQEYLSPPECLSFMSDLLGSNNTSNGNALCPDNNQTPESNVNGDSMLIDSILTESLLFSSEFPSVNSAIRTAQEEGHLPNSLQPSNSGYSAAQQLRNSATVGKKTYGKAEHSETNNVQMSVNGKDIAGSSKKRKRITPDNGNGVNFYEDLNVNKLKLTEKPAVQENVTVSAIEVTNGLWQKEHSAISPHTAYHNQKRSSTKGSKMLRTASSQGVLRPPQPYLGLLKKRGNDISNISGRANFHGAGVAPERQLGSTHDAGLSRVGTEALRGVGAERNGYTCAPIFEKRQVEKELHGAPQRYRAALPNAVNAQLFAPGGRNVNTAIVGKRFCNPSLQPTSLQFPQWGESGHKQSNKNLPGLSKSIPSLSEQQTYDELQQTQLKKLDDLLSFDQMQSSQVSASAKLYADELEALLEGNPGRESTENIKVSEITGQQQLLPSKSGRGNRSLGLPGRSSIRKPNALRLSFGRRNTTGDVGGERKNQKRKRTRVEDLDPTQVHVCSFEDCRKKFAKKYNLKIHERRHRGDLPFICPLCQKKFMWHSSYTRHLRVHESRRESSGKKQRKRKTQCRNSTYHIEKVSKGMSTLTLNGINISVDYRENDSVALAASLCTMSSIPHEQVIETKAKKDIRQSGWLPQIPQIPQIPQVAQAPHAQQIPHVAQVPQCPQPECSELDMIDQFLVPDGDEAHPLFEQPEWLKQSSVA